jgi:hypothetical protein
MTIGSPSLNAADLYHVDLVVPDIDATARRFTSIAGYRWTKPIESTLAVITPTGEHEVPLRFVYSVQAPHLELIQEVTGTIWTAQPGTATHHLGFWVDDLTGTAENLEKAGYCQEARPSGATLSMFAYYIDSAGSRIELVDRALFGDWRAFLVAMSA